MQIRDPEPSVCMDPGSRLAEFILGPRFARTRGLGLAGMTEREASPGRAVHDDGHTAVAAFDHGKRSATFGDLDNLFLVTCRERAGGAADKQIAKDKSSALRNQNS